MADVSLTHDDCMDDPDEGFDQGDCQVMEDVSSLPPLLRVQKYARSSNTCLRQMAVRIVIDILKTVSTEDLLKELSDIMKVLTILVEESILDAELQDEIRSNLHSAVSDILIPLVVRNIGCTDTTVDKAAHAALIQLIEQGFISKPQIEIQVCPSILALSKGETSDDINAKTGAITLMSKLAQHVGRDVMERIFLKRFTELCASPMFCVRKICAGNFGEFCSVIGREALENTLLPCYITLCSDEVYDVRKACAEVITYISCACSLGIRRELLAPAFIKLLQDETRWVKIAAYQSLGPFISTFADPDVTRMVYNKNGELVLTNKNGQEFIMYCSRSLSLSDRYMSLTNNREKDLDVIMTPLSGFLENVLGTAELERDDKEDWYSDGLFKFQDPLDSEDSNLNVINQEPCDNNVKEILNKLNDEMHNLSINDGNIEYDIVNKNSSVVSQLTNSNQPECSRSEANISNKDMNHNENKVNNGDVFEDDLHLFHSNIYWSISPDLPLDLSIIGGKEPSQSETQNLVVTNGNNSNRNSCNGTIIASANLNENGTNLSENSCSRTLSLEENGNSNETEDGNQQYRLVNQTYSNDSTLSLEEVDNCENILQNSIPTVKIASQDVVPQPLIEHFISMTNSDLLLNVDAEMTYYCAYSLPAVALTLGSQNWHILKGTVDFLASDLQYKVRKTLASSLHELAHILGPELATEKLAPLFEGFIKDLDEVRIGVLQHLAEFFELIDPVKRNTYLPRLVEFLKTDNEWNWRFRDELGRQLLKAVNLFKPSDTAKHIGVIAIDLLCDKVAAVRQVALSLITKILGYISTECILTSTLLMRLSEHFAHSKKWKRRQTFCLLCEEILKEESLQPSRFASDLMPHLLDLSWDPVVNVRLVVARCLAVHIITNKYFTNPNNEHCDGLEIVLRRLQADKDGDVRCSAVIASS